MEGEIGVSQKTAFTHQISLKQWIESLFSTSFKDDDFLESIKSGDIPYKIVEYIVNK